jgi:hypothetical protein
MRNCYGGVMARTLILAVLSLLPLSGCTFLSGGGSETGIGGVMGVVVDHTRVGVRGAHVSVMSSGSTPEMVGSATTDGRGEFKIDKVPAGRNLIVSVSKTFGAASIRGHKEGVRVGGGHVTDVGEIELRAGQ